MAEKCQNLRNEMKPRNGGQTILSISSAVTQTHTIPVRVKATRDTGNYRGQTSAWQAPLRKNILMRIPCLIFSCLKTMFIHSPRVRWHNVNVNVNPVCPLGQPVSGTGENGETTSYIHQRLQNSKNWGRFEGQNSTSIAEISPWRQILPAAKICKQSIPAIFWAATAFVPLWLPS